MYKKIKIKVNESGLFGFLKKIPPFLYRRFLRELLPTVDYVRYNGIPVEKIKFGDNFLPNNWRPYNNKIKPNYESALINKLKKKINPGDKIIIVGGGAGVTTLIASRLTGKKGSVICYEASKQSFKKILKTLKLNSALDNINIFNQCVGDPVKVWGEIKDKDYLEPSKLPECDILELDCEGSEKEILKTMKVRPRLILVETHGIFNSPTEEIVGILEGINYRIEEIEIAEIDLREFCLKNDIKVVVAQRLD